MRDPGLQYEPRGDTLAEGIAVKQPGELTSRILRELANDDVLVPERDLERAVAMLVGIEKTVVEGAGAAGLAAILSDPSRYKGKKVATLLCGGNIDTHCRQRFSFVTWSAKPNRTTRVAAEDRPERSPQSPPNFHEAGVNIIEINHSRSSAGCPPRDTVIEVECEAKTRKQSMTWSKG